MSSGGQAAFVKDNIVNVSDFAGHTRFLQH